MQKYTESLNIDICNVSCYADQGMDLEKEGGEEEEAREEEEAEERRGKGGEAEGTDPLTSIIGTPEL